MSNILVTGGCGFLGKAVCEQLNKRGYKNIIQLKREDCDLRDKEAVINLFNKHQPNQIIHLAATVGGIGANKARPGEFFYDNILMGVNVIEQSRISNIEKFVLISTVCSYPNLTPVPFTEENLWDGYPEKTNAPYGVAKRALMEMLSAYRKQYNFNGITLIPVNLYGPNDNFHPYNSHVIASLLIKVKNAIQSSAKELIVWGTGNASREFLYVEDAATGIVDGLEKYNKEYPINLGTGKEIKIKDLVEKICYIMGFHGKIIFDSSQPDGQMRRCLDISKAKQEFGFTANTDFDTGLTKTINWYMENINV